MTRTAGSPAPLALRIDVDFPAGLTRAVPVFLDGLRAAGMRATFFVVAGDNRTGRLLGRLFRPGYARRLWRLGPLRVARRLGLAGSAGSFLGSPRATEVIRRIVAEGSEVAVHGLDHAWWSDEVWTADACSIERQIDGAYRVTEAATGESSLAWGSPGWRTTDDVLWSLRRRGVAYFSDCWGREPFVTLDETGREIPGIHLPITLPSLESLILAQRLAPAEAVAGLLDRCRPGCSDVACLHDYFEGLLRPELFGMLLDGCLRRGLTTIPLREAAGNLAALADALPRAPLTRAALPGFTGRVSWQGPLA